MNKTQLSVETLEARLALKLTSELSRENHMLPHDIAERLRVARQGAIRLRRPEPVHKPAVSDAWQPSGATSAGLQTDPSESSHSRWMTLVLTLALIAGIFYIQHVNLQSQVLAAADVDVELLADDLPPDAYIDAGFLEFLKHSPE
jgi:hypothetical protein